MDESSGEDVEERVRGEAIEGVREGMEIMREREMEGYGERERERMREGVESP